MPSNVNRGRFPPQRVVVPERVAINLRSEALRETIPARVTLAENAVPYAGEVREEHTSPRIKLLGVGQQVTLATLRRAWNFVGWAVNPGDAPDAVTLTASLKLLTRGLDAYTAFVPVPNGQALAVVGLVIGAACELVVRNVGAVPVHGLLGSIWGMGEK